MMKKRWMVVAGSAILLLGWYVFRTYPRRINITLRGVQYKLGSSRQVVTPVTLTLHGTYERPLFGPETFSGTIEITGTTRPDRANGKDQTIPINPYFGGQIVYYSGTNHFSEYGAIYPNRNFTAFAVQEWQHSGWNSANGLLIAAPAKTRVQALRLSNELMKTWLGPGHVLK